MQNIFTALTHAVEGTAPIALTAAMLWGILSILLSPCHLAAIPLIVGFIDNREKVTTARAFAISFIFAFGILITIAVIGIITAAAGRMMGDIGSYGNYFVATIFFGVGLHLLGVLKNPFGKDLDQIEMQGRGIMSAFLLGLIFGIALGPCSFAYMAPLLGISFKLGAAHPVYAGSLLLMYGIGHCSIIVLAGTSTGIISRYMNWNRKSGGALLLKRICGILVIISGLYLIYIA